jgi:ATP-dependent protease HslVU (ClpYQ) peptidase subunit
MSVNISGITKVYSGKRSRCACGCSGKYSYTAHGAVEDNPGYDVSDSVNERSVKIIAKKVLSNPNTDHSAPEYAVLEQGERVLVVFYKQ